VGGELNMKGALSTKTFSGRLFISMGEVPLNTYPLPDEMDTVVKISF